ncbi:MAG: hypothetical protein KBD01_01135 [Acidobacteria bacterium]|nr:hypothetical protein [Acidobacteriota bacterium]
MATLSSDTSPDAERVLIDTLRRMAPWRKLELLDDAVRTTRELVLCGLRSRYPQATADELRLRWLHLLLGAELATRAYGPLPGP